MPRLMFGSIAIASALISGAGAHAQPAIPAGVAAQQAPAGTIYTDTKGMTLYTLDDDIGSGGSTCGGDCSQNFPPLTAPADAKPVGGWSAITRSDGSKQWAFKGAAVYTYSHDANPGDRNGSAYIPVTTAIANDPMKQVWHVLWQPPALRPGITLGAVNKGRILADAKGMTVYVSDKDSARGEPACDGACLDEWIPLGAPAVAIAKGDWSVVSRADGITQWAYRGKPLYTSRKDVKPGETKSDGEDGNWHAFVVLPVPTAPAGVTLQNSDIGSVYADAQGHTLYAWFQPLEHLKLTCNDDCMRANWKPALAPDNLSSGTGWTTIARPDGTKQLAYGGQPLYSFTQDTRPGDIAGYNFGYRSDQQSGAWQPVRPWY